MVSVSYPGNGLGNINTRPRRRTPRNHLQDLNDRHEEKRESVGWKVVVCVCGGRGEEEVGVHL